ncbi:hypothetical protein JHK82_040305 [Glycine max]|nr:hypothetical protein JHK82_040305 [Glycine max]
MSSNCYSVCSYSDEAALILIRYGESLWNEKNLFTGCVDVPLSKRGIDEAIEAGKRIRSIPVDLIFTSALIQAQMTAMLAMTQHPRKKVPIIMHNESEQAREWSQVFSMGNYRVSISKKQQTDMGKNKCMSGVEVMTYLLQMVKVWKCVLKGQLPISETKLNLNFYLEKNVMISAHGNSLTSIIMYLDKLTSQKVISLELSTGIPMLYIFKEGRFIRRGSPIGPTETGVYAHTRRLALYRQRLDDMFQ